MVHIPVLLEEVITYFRSLSGGTFIDATVGYGGHTFAILERIPDSTVFGIDADASALAFVNEERKRRGISDRRLILAQGNFRHCASLATTHGIPAVNGILFDFGVSSGELEDASRGFSFVHDGPLDMRFNQREGETAADIVQQWPAHALEKCFRAYGEEPHARVIAEAIVRQRSKAPITSTGVLAELIAKLPVTRRRGRLHPATRVFQALRIVVNDELTAIERVLPDAIALLAPQGRLATIAFHSLEDRIVKTFVKEEAKKKTIRILTKHVVPPAYAEVQKNPRSRSARLRVVEKI